jgi:hypothetical protein
VGSKRVEAGDEGTDAARAVAGDEKPPVSSSTRVEKWCGRYRKEEAKGSPWVWQE